MATVKSYADYAKEQLGVQDGAKLSSYQKQKNRVSYQKYVNNYLAEQQKNEQLAEIEKNKSAALSESAIATERARKYVNAVNKHLGIAGTGYGESKAIDLFAQEAKRRAEINNAHSAQENEALKAYKQAIANAELAENEAMGNIELAEDQEAESKRQGYVETLRQVLEQRNSEEGMSDEDFSRYYNEYSKYLGDDDALLKEDLKNVYDDITKYDNYNTVTANEGNVEANNTLKNPNWYIQGLGTGRRNDDIDITIGATSRNKKEEFDLLCGDRVEDTKKIFALNKLATGDENRYPNIEGKNNSGDSQGQLVVYKGDMYVYTRKGWRIVIDDNKDGEAKRAVEVYMNYINSNE